MPFDRHFWIGLTIALLGMTLPLAVAVCGAGR